MRIKTFILPVVICSAIGVSGGAYGVTCASLGLSIGETCWDDAFTERFHGVGWASNQKCVATDAGCKIVECGGTCYCLKSSTCNFCPDECITSQTKNGVRASCVNSSSISAYCEYKCISGYYGTGNDSFGGCTKCPQSITDYDALSDGGNGTTASSCYVVPDDFSDSTGRGELLDDCYWK